LPIQFCAVGHPIARLQHLVKIGVLSPNRRKFRRARFRPADALRAGTFRFSMVGGARSGRLEPAWMPVAAFCLSVFDLKYGKFPVRRAQRYGIQVAGIFGG